MPARRHRLFWGALAVLSVVLVALFGAAWLVSPSGSGLGRHVAARLEPSGARPVALDRVAPVVRDAVVATEDERFFQHDGIDVIGIMRALPYDLVHLSFAQGASTITEQVGKILYLHGSDHSPWGKLEDAALALKLEGRYGKDQILSAYLNSVYFGEGAYGIRAASRTYFGLPPSRLGVAEASLLAGLIQAPTAFDPLRHPAQARARQIEVLRSMVADGYLTEGEAEAALHARLPLRGGATLPAAGNVQLEPGPAFVWWELALGCTIALAGIASLLFAPRMPRLRPAHTAFAVRATALAVSLIGVAAMITSFRTA
jgi:membrane peptidoglycan carboxypeptidase